jgi:hypothetical protein
MIFSLNGNKITMNKDFPCKPCRLSILVWHSPKSWRSGQLDPRHIKEHQIICYTYVYIYIYLRRFLKNMSNQLPSNCRLDTTVLRQKMGQTSHRHITYRRQQCFFCSLSYPWYCAIPDGNLSTRTTEFSVGWRGSWFEPRTAFATGLTLLNR